MRVSFFGPAPHCFDHYSLIVWLEIREHDTSSFVFLFQYFFGYWGRLYLHTNFRIVCSSFVKTSIGILIEIELNYVDHFG